MMRFLKLVRFNSFFQKGFRKYFIYAFGEIFLIVLGILIALQVNDWNEERKTFKEETILLKKLKNDLESDLLRFQELTKMYKTSLENNLKFKKRLETGIISEKDLDATNFHVFNFSQLNPRTATRDEMISFGWFHKISNDSLANSIHEYYRVLERDAYYILRHDQKIRTVELNPDVLKFKLLKDRFFGEYSLDETDVQWLNDPADKSYSALINLLLVAYEENNEALKIFEKLQITNSSLRRDLEIHLKEKGK